ncbi:hypothetical protein LOD99_7035 [Oopsacas minuta]|uniref:Uncharacterized protein n=1 Tax=Oopsacas minuta TaxID=111878 RepID=A0AAV7JJ28_9METZ|nr:hypothetical protein LOD99_7035 [Oopsacas minuta]
MEIAHIRAGVVGRINPYCSCRANFRSVKEVKACLSATSDSSIISKESKSPSSIFSIRTPPSKRSTHNVITPEARSMMKDAIAEFSSPLTDIKKIPIRESPLFPIPPSKRRKLFDMRDSILKEVEMRKMKQKSEKDNIIERQNSIDIAVKKHYDRINAEQELRNIQELYPEFSFSNPISLKNKSITEQSFDGQFIFSNTVSANLTK